MADIENKMNIVDVDIEKEMKKSYLEYAKDKRAASRRHRAVQRELSPVLGLNSFR